MIDYIKNIAEKQLSIYDLIDLEDDSLFIPIESLEKILSDSLVGFSVEGFKLRTRSKVVKSEICKALGYPVPRSFKKTHPRFPGQNFDEFTQKSRNVQIWNEEVAANRRYVIVRVSQDDIIDRVRVITGDQLAILDKTGKLTRKYQARMKSYGQNICSLSDTKAIDDWIHHNNHSSCNLHTINPTSFPQKEHLLSIHEIFNRLLPLVGTYIDYIDAVQERNRGAKLHSLICSHLGYSIYEDDGTYPDIANQLLEVKLQTSPTIDLGLHSPNDNEKIVTIGKTSFYSHDIRYAIFDGKEQGDKIYLQNLYLVSGEDFQNYFPLFQGKGSNSKIQIRLPESFFD